MTSPPKPMVREQLAECDLEGHVDYFAGFNSSVAQRFLDAAERAFERIHQNPEIGGLWNFENPRLAGIRVWPIPGFRRILIFYRVTDAVVQVLRVLHGSRDLESLLAR